jgi:hypothetical protein
MQKFNDTTAAWIYVHCIIGKMRKFSLTRFSLFLSRSLALKTHEQTRRRRRRRRKLPEVQPRCELTCNFTTNHKFDIFVLT